MSLEDELKIARSITRSVSYTYERKKELKDEAQLEVDWAYLQLAGAKKLEESLEQKLIERNINVPKLPNSDPSQEPGS